MSGANGVARCGLPARRRLCLHMMVSKEVAVGPHAHPMDEKSKARRGFGDLAQVSGRKWCWSENQELPSSERALDPSEARPGASFLKEPGPPSSATPAVGKTELWGQRLCLCLTTELKQESESLFTLQG